ncbi:hypothetical protein HN51_010975 [Arachis hypogaea]
MQVQIRFNLGNVKDGMAPKYFCGKYAICYMSKTDTNPNRLFFGCPLLKVTEAHCKFFLWVDDHIVRVRAEEATRDRVMGSKIMLKNIWEWIT